jgi:hypothetical protein
MAFQCRNLNADTTFILGISACPGKRSGTPAFKITMLFKEAGIYFLKTISLYFV